MMQTANHSTTAHRARSVLAPFYSVSLVLIILLASIERIYGIDRQSLWSDELFAVTASYAKDWQSLWAFLINDSHPPGYVLFMCWTLPLSTYSDFEIRMHALFFGIYWIPVVFYICKRWFSPDVGLLAATLTASAYAAIYFSQEARAYSMLITFILVNLACYMEILFRDNPRKIFLYGFIISTILSLYFHYSGFVFFSAEIFLYALLLLTRQRKGNFKEAFQLFVIPLLAYAPWFFVMMQQVLHGHAEWAVSAPPTGNDAFMLIQRLLGPDYEHLQFYAVCLITAAALVFNQLRRNRLEVSHKVLCSIFFLAVTPVIAFYIKSLISTPIFEKRYFLHVVPFIAIIAGYSIDWTLQKLTNHFWHKTALVVVLIIYSAWTIHTNINKGLYAELDKDPIREAARLVRDDINRNNITPDKYTTLMTFNWFEHYVRHFGLNVDLDWQFHVFYIPQQVGKVQQFLRERPNIEYFYYLQFEQKGSSFAANALRQQFKLLSKAKLESNSPFDISVLKFSAKEAPSDSDLAQIGSNPTNDAAKWIASKTYGQSPDTYNVLVTHDWMEPYLQRNNVHIDSNSPLRKFYGDWMISELTAYLSAHPAVETVHYMALREQNALLAADALTARYKLLDKFSIDSSAGMIDTYSFSARQTPTDAEIRSIHFLENNPVNNAIASLQATGMSNNPEKNTVIFSHDWMEPYLIHNSMPFDKDWSDRHYYIDLQTEKVLAYLNQHPSIESVFYIALRNPETERAALLLKLPYTLVNQLPVEMGAGIVDIYQFNTKAKPADISALKSKLAGSPLNDIADWLARDMGRSGKSATVFMTHDWFKPYLRAHDVVLDTELQGNFYSDPQQLPALLTYLHAHPEFDNLYFLALHQPNLQPAINALKSSMRASCKKMFDAPVGKLAVMRFNIKEAANSPDAAVPACTD